MSEREADPASDERERGVRRAGGVSAAAVRRPVAALMFALIVATLGLVAGARLPVDLVPEFEFPSVTVFAPLDGAGSQEVESLVLEPLEEATASVPGVREMSGTARDGSAVLRLTFDFESDLVQALDDVRVAVERARSRLPEDLEPPQVFRFDPNQFPIAFVGVSGDRDLRELTRIARDELKPRLARVPGVVAVDLRGAFERQIHLELNLERMLDLGVTLDEVERAVANENLDVSGGKVRAGGREVGVRTVATKRGPDELRDIPVAERDGRTLRLSDVARITDTAADRANVTRIEGFTAIRLGIRKGSGENTVAVAAEVRRLTAQLDAEYPDIDVRMLLDTSEYIESAVDGAERAALLGGLLAIAVLLLFLRSFRATLLVAVAIPVSVLSAFLAMERFGSTLNLMTLGGLSLGVGMLVDNAIVVLEAIVARLQRGRSGTDAALEGTGEVGLAVAASTATTLVIFIPVLFLEGIQRVIYGQLALVVVVALVASLVVSLTLVPAFAGRLFAERGLSLDDGAILRPLAAAYERVLAAAIGSPKSTLAALLGVALAASSLWPQVKTEFVPETDQGKVSISVRYPLGTPIERTDALVARLAQICREVVPEADRVYATVGPGGWWSSASSEVGSISVTLPSRTERPRGSEEVARALRAAMPQVPGAKIGVRTSGGFFLLRMIQGGGGGDNKLTVEVRGEDLENMAAASKKAVEVMEAVPGVVDVQENESRGRPELVIEVDPERAASLGLSAGALGRQVETYLRGRRVTSLRTVAEDIPVVLRLSPEDRTDVERLRMLLLSAPKTDTPVALSEVARFVPREGPVVIERSEGSRIVYIGAQVEGRPLGEVATELRAGFAKLSLPRGTRLRLAGEVEEQEKVFSSMALGVLLALVLVYMVMAAQFESLVLPLLVMGAVPFAGVGVMVLFGLGGATLNIYSFMGVIVLVGIAVNNAIVLVDTAGVLRREEGLSVSGAVLAASKRRLRPILMTTTTTVLGLLPVALSRADGAELQGPLARVVVAGMLTSTAVTLLLIPTLYAWIEGARQRRRDRGDAV